MCRAVFSVCGHVAAVDVVNDFNWAWRPRYGLYDEEEKIQVLGGVSPGGAC